MEKKTISVHAFTVHLYTIAIVVLLFLLLILGIKYLHLKWSVQKYTNSTIWMNQQGKPAGQISDYGKIVAVSAVEYVSSDKLQTYVTVLSKKLNRDIVVLDKNKKILADTISTNKGTIYTYDSDKEINATLSDGKTRTFVEKSVDYPNGITEVIVPTENADGEITGVILMSNQQLQ